MKEQEKLSLDRIMKKGLADDQQAIQVEAKVMQKIVKDKLLWLDNLLCTIHRDGGHYIADNGYQKAYDKAMKKVIAWLQKDDSNFSA